MKIKISKNKINQLSVRTMALSSDKNFVFTGGEISLINDKEKNPFVTVIDIEQKKIISNTPIPNVIKRQT